LATISIPNMTDHENHNVANSVVQWDFPLRTDEFLDIFIKHLFTDFNTNSLLNDADKQLENR
jgi:hypothetical protein